VRFPNQGLARELKAFLKAHRTGFLYQSPDRSWSETVENFTYTGSETFPLEKKFVNASTVVVKVDGVVDANWGLSGNNTAPVITPTGGFATGAVEITYRYYYQVRTGPNPLRGTTLVPGPTPALDCTIEVFEIDPGKHLVA